MAEAKNRDVIVIGGSAGGFEALSKVAQRLPSDLPASVLVVLHSNTRSRLAEALAVKSALPVQPAENGAEIRPGRVYVAVPDFHLLLHDGHMLLRRGPRENRSRPAIDPLFRSAAVSFGVRAIGVVLSGALNDGTAGLMAVKQCGGVTIVQDPDDAAVPDMPNSARGHVEPDHVAPAAAIGELLDRLARQSPGPGTEIPDRLKFEVAMAAQELQDMTSEHQNGKLPRFICPECGGALWEIADGDLLRYRCHVGHAFTAETMLAYQEENIEETMWTLMRTHADQADLARRAAEHLRRQDRDALAEQLVTRAEGYAQDADLFRKLLTGREPAIKPKPQSGK